MNKEELERLIGLNYSTHKMATELGRSQTNVRRWLIKYGLKTNLFQRIKLPDKICINCNIQFPYNNKYSKYCSLKCQNLYQTDIIKEQIRNSQYKSTGRQMIYETLCDDFGNKCSLCGLDGNNWNGKSIRLWVDHIDGYANNNQYYNFRLVCPNCDSQLDTCRAKNKGRGRKSLGLKVC